MRDPERWMALLSAAWLGGLLTVAAIATPAAFAALEVSDAGRVASRMLQREAAASVVIGASLLALHRWRARLSQADSSDSSFDLTLGLAAGAVFCTLAGYYALQPLMADAKAARGQLSFSQLHAISVAFFVVKMAAVATLAVRLSVRISRKPTS